jgi:hypothetical protein
MDHQLQQLTHFGLETQVFLMGFDGHKRSAKKSTERKWGYFHRIQERSA